MESELYGYESPEAALLSVRRRIEKYLEPQTANFWCHIIEGSFATFGMGIVAAGQVFQAIAETLGATATFMGVLNAVGGLGVLAPLLFAPMVEAAKRKKRLVLLLGVGQRVPFVMIPLALLTLATDYPLACLMVIAVVRLGSGVVVSVLVPPWQDLLAETIPRQKVGRLFGYRHMIASGIGFVAGPLSAVVVGAWAFPGNYALLYFVALISVVISWLIFALVDEVPDDVVVRQRMPALEYFRDLAQSIRQNRDYRWFLLYQAVSRVGFAAMALYVFAVLRYFKVSQPFAVGVAMTAPHVANVLGNLPLAWLGERIGPKRVMEIGAALHAAAAVVAALAPSGIWYVGVFFISGLGVAAKAVSSAPFMMNVSPRGSRVGYISLSMVMMAPVGIAAAFSAGYLMDVLGYRTLFLLAAAAVLASVIPLEHCRPCGRYVEEEQVRPDEEETAP